MAEKPAFSVPIRVLFLLRLKLRDYLAFIAGLFDNFTYYLTYMIWIENSDMLGAIGEFLSEDIGRGDITTQACVPPDVRGVGRFLAKEDLVVCGLEVAEAVFAHLDAESPEIEAIIVESIDPEGPFGAKEASEGSLAATIPAIANAIYDAVGVRLHESPFTPERVLAALRAKKNAKPISMTEGVDPTAPTRFREHGGSLWFRGKGPERHPLDPARRAPAEAGGDD